MIDLSINNMRFKWKVFIFLLGFCVLLLIVLWLFHTVFLDAIYRYIRVSEIRRDAAVIESNAGGADISEIIADISDNSDIAVDITDMDGKSILQIELPSDRQSWESNAAIISLAIENGGEFFDYSSLPEQTSRYRFFPGNRQPMQSLVYVKLAYEPEIGDIAVVIRATVSPVYATVTALRYQFYFTSGTLMVLAIVLAIAISKRVSRPIEEINRSAMTIAAGNYDTRFSGKGFYEIVALSETLNAAAVELGKVERLRRDLLANVSHDLRTPLSLIYSYAEMMSDFPGEIAPEQTRVIMEEARRLTTLVNDVLDISKLENEVERLNISHFNLTKNISETTQRLEKLLKGEGFSIVFEKSADVHIEADETKINRAFYNLLVNAVNYSGDCREVSVRQTVFDMSVRISVTDCGEGIAEEDLPFIWDR